MLMEHSESEMEKKGLREGIRLLCGSSGGESDGEDDSSGDDDSSG